MAKTVITLTIDVAAMNDALDLLAEIQVRLARRHGDVFRRLDREIERFADDPSDFMDVHSLGKCELMAAPAGKLTEIFRQARLLGVID